MLVEATSCNLEAYSGSGSQLTKRILMSLAVGFLELSNAQKATTFNI